MTIDFKFRAHLAREQYHLGCHIAYPAIHGFLRYQCPAAILAIDESRSYSGIANACLETIVDHRGAPPLTREIDSSSRLEFRPAGEAQVAVA